MSWTKKSVPIQIRCSIVVCYQSLAEFNHYGYLGDEKLDAVETMFKKQKLPQFDSIDELAQFWDAHDLTDFEDELEEVTEPLFVQNEQESVVKFYLQFQELAMLSKLAQTRGIRQDMLVREWVLEKLQAA